jgi:DNA-3-methyladenine glycosylase
MARIGREFFNRPTLKVSRDLIGKFVVRSWRGRKIVGMITETEAYIGPKDRAAHSYLPAHRIPQKWHPKFEELLRPHVENPKEYFMKWAATGAKITPRTLAEYLDGGTIYIYLVYGMYWNMNFSTAGPDIPECVLIRGTVPVRDNPDGSYDLLWNEYKTSNGPGKFCNYFRFDKTWYAKNICDTPDAWMEDRGVAPRKIKKGPRVGIDYAGPYWAAKPWRFLLEPPTSSGRR